MYKIALLFQGFVKQYIVTFSSSLLRTSLLISILLLVFLSFIPLFIRNGLSLSQTNYFLNVVICFTICDSSNSFSFSKTRLSSQIVNSLPTNKINGMRRICTDEIVYILISRDCVLNISTFNTWFLNFSLIGSLKNYVKNFNTEPDTLQPPYKPNILISRSIVHRKWYQLFCS